jgi:hypothetical protein
MVCDGQTWPRRIERHQEREPNRNGKPLSFYGTITTMSRGDTGPSAGRRGVSKFLDGVGRLIARYLQQTVHGYEPFTPSDPEALRRALKPADILLVEGNTHIAGVIKYLTQSTWSHAALYVGPIAGRAEPDGEPHVLIDANVGEGVESAPLSKYAKFHTRVCRAVELSSADADVVCAYAVARIGFAYDLKNIIDLMRYLFPLPVPQRWRRRLIALGSGDPSRLICSALIADAFRAVKYPILPKVMRTGSKQIREQMAEIRHSSLYCPRDFDISPYFNVVKPTIANGFNYKALRWATAPQMAMDGAVVEPIDARLREATVAEDNTAPAAA